MLRDGPDINLPDNWPKPLVRYKISTLKDQKVKAKNESQKEKVVEIASNCHKFFIMISIKSQFPDNDSFSLDYSHETLLPGLSLSRSQGIHVYFHTEGVRRPASFMMWIK